MSEEMYRFRDKNNANANANANGYESGYESGDGTEYRAHTQIGKGLYARARLFQSKDGQKKKVVLDPRNAQMLDIAEAKAKYDFFRALYGLQSAELYIEEYVRRITDYRLVLPLIPGISYLSLRGNDKRQHIKLFFTAIQALRHCHSEGYIVLDLKEDNILYDERTGQSYLIDGGFAVMKGEVQPRFRMRSEAQAMEYKQNYPHYAPECFSVIPVRANESMDIYSLGYMMAYVCTLADAALEGLFELCQAPDPSLRPTLDQLEEKLLALPQAKAIKVELLNARAVALAQSLSNFKVNFSDKNTNKALEKHEKFLKDMLKNFSKTHDELRNESEKLGFDFGEDLNQMIKDKEEEIENIAQSRKERLNELNKRLAPINNALIQLGKKIAAIDPFRRVYGEAKKLLDSLETYQADYSSLYLNGSKDENIENIFRQKCLDAVNRVAPFLEQELDWGSELNHLSIILTNSESNLVGWSSFYTPVQQSTASHQLAFRGSDTFNL